MSADNRLGRRRFLALAGGTLGITALAGSGAAVAGAQEPTVEFREPSYGGKREMGERILVAYASRRGSTGEVAEAIGRALAAGGATVDVRLVQNVGDLSPYRAVVVGSAIRGSRWLPEAMEFLTENRQSLSEVATAHFLVCRVLREDTPENWRTAMGYMERVREQVPDIDPFALGLFAGKLDPNAFSPLMRVGMRLNGTEAGDWRDWGKIEAWAASLQPVLLAA